MIIYMKKDKKKILMISIMIFVVCILSICLYKGFKINRETPSRAKLVHSLEESNYRGDNYRKRTSFY